MLNNRESKFTDAFCPAFVRNRLFLTKSPAIVDQKAVDPSPLMSRLKIDVIANSGTSPKQSLVKCREVSYVASRAAMATVFDVCVVGAGVEGSSTARYLATRGKKTLLIEQV